MLSLPGSLTARPCKMDGWKTILSFWKGKISGAMLNFRSVTPENKNQATKTAAGRSDPIHTVDEQNPAPTLDGWNPLNNWTIIILGVCRILSINRSVRCFVHSTHAIASLLLGCSKPCKMAKKDHWKPQPYSVSARSLRLTPQKKLACHQKKGSSQKEMFIFQPLIFKTYESFFRRVLKMDLYQVTPICCSTGRSRKKLEWNFITRQFYSWVATCKMLM